MAAHPIPAIPQFHITSPSAVSAGLPSGLGAVGVRCLVSLCHACPLWP